ncbi:MAG: hypothetical protein WCX48_04940 [Bacteroidales bacterium]
MEITVLPYNLPDMAVLDSPGEFEYSIWQPDRIYVILGRSNTASASLYTQTIQNDGVMILKRPSGGESVILSPKMLVFSVKMRFQNKMNSRFLFKQINDLLIKYLSEVGIENLHSRGISDLSIDSRKIMGSSIYLNRDTLFYHAVLNISEDISLISRYLKHPSREPDYRRGRGHEEFVTSLYREGYNLSFEVLANQIFLVMKELQSEIN